MKPPSVVLIAASVFLAVSMVSIAGATGPSPVYIQDSGGSNSVGVDTNHNLQTKICDPNTAGRCATVSSNNDLLVKVDDNGSSVKLEDGATSTKAQVNTDGSVETADFGSTVTVSAADTSCHFVTAKSLNRLINGLGSAQSVSVTLYLNESSATCTSSTTIVDQPGTTQFQDIQVPITSGSGFSYKWSGAPSGTVLFTSN